jgi:hypothetical protein
MPQRAASSAMTSWQDRLALGGEVAHELFGVLEQLDRLAEVDDVDAGTLTEDERLHLGVPALGLVADVPAWFELVFQRAGGQLSSKSRPGGGAAHRPRA